MSSLALYADVACVHSYLGFTQLRRALGDARRDGRHIELRLHPLLVAPDAPVGRGEPLQDVHSRDLGLQWRSMESAMTCKGKAAGAPMDFKRVQFTSTIPAHVVVQQAQRQAMRYGEEVLASLFGAYFVSGALISDTGWLTEHCRRHGFPEPVFTPAEYARVTDQVDQAHQNGITTAPTLLSSEGKILTGARSQADYASFLRENTF